MSDDFSKFVKEFKPRTQISKPNVPSQPQGIKITESPNNNPQIFSQLPTNLGFVPKSSDTMIYSGSEGTDQLSESSLEALRNVGWKEGDPYNDAIIQIATGYAKKVEDSMASLPGVKPPKIIQYDEAPEEVKQMVAGMVDTLKSLPEEHTAALTGRYNPSVSESIRVSRSNIVDSLMSQSSTPPVGVTEPSLPADEQYPPIDISVNYPIPDVTAPEYKAEQAAREESVFQQQMKLEKQEQERIERQSKPTDEDRALFISTMAGNVFRKSYTFFNDKAIVQFREISKNEELAIAQELAKNYGTAVDSVHMLDATMSGMRYRLLVAMESLKLVNSDGTLETVWMRGETLQQTLDSLGLNSLSELMDVFLERVPSTAIREVLHARYIRFTNLLANLIQEVVHADF